MMKPLIALAALLAATAAEADILIDNINGYQVDAEGRLRSFNGLLVGDAGKVKIVLTPGAARPGPVERVIDMGGKTMLPGLIDAHGHILGLGFAALQLDLTGVASLAELQQRLKDYATANPDARWIVGRGWNQELWPVKVFPTAADLDAAIGDRPVVLTRVDGHALVANSAAMSAAGVTAELRAPEGGRIENGLFVDTAMPLIESRIPAPSLADFDAALAKAQQLMLSVGLTGAADMGTSPGDWAAMNRAGQAGALDVRIISYAGGLEAMRAINGDKPSGWLHGDRLRLTGVKLYADGALGSRGAWLKRPYADQPDTVGLRFLTDAELREQVGVAAASGFQLAIHAIGDAANAQAIGAFEQVGRTHSGDRRWRIEHVQVIDPADIPRLAKVGIIASMQPVHQTSDRLMAEKRLDPPRLVGAYAWQTIARSGARLAFGSDFPVESPNPFPGLAAAISRQDLDGQPPGGLYADERVTLAQALDGFTRGAAYAGFAEDRIGSLEPGKWADFIIVDRDPTKADAQALARTQVLETWVAGKKVWTKEVSGAGGERGR